MHTLALAASTAAVVAKSMAGKLPADEPRTNTKKKEWYCFGRCPNRE
jgi:hypothetical protein